MTFFVLGEEDVVIGFQFVGISGKAIEFEEDRITSYNVCYTKLLRLSKSSILKESRNESRE